MNQTYFEDVEIGSEVPTLRKDLNQSKKTVALQRTTGISYQPQD